MTNFSNNRVFQVENKRSNSKLLITVEHAGNLIPKKVNLGLNKQDSSRHISYDIGIKGVALEICKKTDFKCILSIAFDAEFDFAFGVAYSVLMTY